MRDGGYSPEFTPRFSETLPEIPSLLEEESDSEAAYVDFVFQKKVNEAKHLNEINQHEHAMYIKMAPAVQELQEQLKKHQAHPSAELTNYLVRAFSRLSNQFPLPRETRDTLGRFGNYLHHKRYELIQGVLQSLLDYPKSIADYQRKIQPPLEAAAEIEQLMQQTDQSNYEIQHKKEVVAKNFHFPFDVSLYSPSIARATLEVRQNYLRRLRAQPPDFLTRYEIERIEEEIAILKQHLETVHSDSGVRIKNNDQTTPPKPFDSRDTDVALPYTLH